MPELHLEHIHGLVDVGPRNEGVVPLNKIEDNQLGFRRIGLVIGGFIQPGGRADPRFANTKLVELIPEVVPKPHLALRVLRLGCLGLVEVSPAVPVHQAHHSESGHQ